MEQANAVTNPVLFAYYAGDDIETWKLIVGCPVTHKTYGRGVVDDVYQRPFVEPADDVTVQVQFDEPLASQQGERRLRFAGRALGKAFTDLTLPPGLEHTDSLREKAQQQMLAEQERDEALEAERRREAQQKEEAEERREREAQARAEFARLRKKYLVTRPEDSSQTSRLYMILLHIDRGETVDGGETAWLEQNGFHQVAGFVFYQRYRASGDGWDLVRAGAKWRQAGCPQQALAATAECCAGDAGVMGAVMITRGDANRDIGNLDEAEICALAVAKSSPLDYRPYNLLGAIQYQRGNPEQGDECFRKAAELGSPDHRDSLIKRAVRDAGVEERRRVAKYLLQEDSKRYAWVRANRW